MTVINHIYLKEIINWFNYIPCYFAPVNKEKKKSTSYVF